MPFAHDTEQGLAAAAALVNTAGRDGEQLPDPAALDKYARAGEWTGQRTHDQAENRSKRYCDTGCSNRAAVDAYRARLRSAAAPSSH